MSKDLGFHDPAPEDRGSGIYGGIGDVLRQARERRGVSLPQIASQLRISESYLAAIEHGRFSQLPGRSYVLGFLRSYAAFLGLNADKVVAQYKIEADDDIARQQQLKFPTVRPEGRTPGLWLLPLVMILAAVGYLGWYGWKTDLVSFDDVVPEVPARLRTDSADSGATAAPAPGTAAERPRAEGGALDPREQANGAGDEMRLAVPDTAAPPTELPAEDNGADATAFEPAPAGTAPGGAAPAGAEAGLADPVEAGEDVAGQPPAAGSAAGQDAGGQDAAGQIAADADPDAPPPLPSDPEPASADAGGGAVAATATDGTPLADAPVPDGRTFGTTDARVVLRARADTWVQVEDAQRNLLLTRVLKAGDTYGAPNQAGLVLMTGNAGGLVVEVDGEPVPSLGPRGAVRRNVSLDPERLLDGSQAIN